MCAEGWLILAVLPVLFRIGVAALPVFHLGVSLSLRFEAVMLVPWFFAAAGWLRSRSSDPP